MDTLAKIAFAILSLGVFFAFLFAVLPVQFSSFSLSTWSSTLDSIVSFFNSILGQLSSFIDISLFIIIFKIVFTLYLIGFSIKLFQFILGYFSGK